MTIELRQLFNGGVAEPLVYTSLGILASRLVGVWKRHRGRKALTESDLFGPATIVTATIFTPSGIINTRTKNEYYDLKIRNYKTRVNLGEVFHSAITEEILDYIEAARKLCTREDPVIFEHFPKIIPPERLQKVQEILAEQWVSYFSAMQTDLPSLYSRLLGPREELVERTVYPILIYDPTARIKQYRVHLVEPDQLEIDNFPNIRDLRFQIGDRFVHDLKHRHAKRLRTCLETAEALAKPENKWIVEQLAVSIATTQIRTIPEVDMNHGLPTLDFELTDEYPLLVA